MNSLSFSVLCAFSLHGSESTLTFCMLRIALHLFFNTLAHYCQEEILCDNLAIAIESPILLN